MIYPSFIYLLDMLYIRYYDIDSKIRSVFVLLKSNRLEISFDGNGILFVTLW